MSFRYLTSDERAAFKDAVPQGTGRVTSTRNWRRGRLKRIRLRKEWRLEMRRIEREMADAWKKVEFPDFSKE